VVALRPLAVLGHRRAAPLRTAVVTALEVRPDRAVASWAGTARVWGLLASAAYLVATAAILAQMLAPWGPEPQYVDGTDQVRSEAQYFAALFAHQEQSAIWALVAATGLAVAFVCLVPLFAAAAVLARSRGPAVWLALVFGGITSVLVVGYAALSVVPIPFWGTGWDEAAPTVVVAVGRDLAIVQDAEQQIFAGAMATMALSLAHLARACRVEPVLPNRLWPVCAAGAAALTAMIVMDLLDIGSDLASMLLIGATGGLIAPLVAGVLGVRLGRSD
jgi:hypothetical protein